MAAVFAFVLSFVTVGYSADYVREDFVLAGLSTSDNVEQVVSKLGEPNSIEEKVVKDVSGGTGLPVTYYKYNYNDVVVYIFKGHVIDVTVTDSQYVTYRGLRVGDHLNDLTAAYGTTKISVVQRNGDILYQYIATRNPDGCIDFTVDPSTQRIMKISVNSSYI